MDFFTFHEQVTKRAAPNPPKGNVSDALTVTQLTQRIEKALKETLPPSFLVRGEISNARLQASSGHFYFTMKDASCCVDCVMYRSEFARLKFRPDDGMEVIASGRIGVYGPKGRYQLCTTHLDPIGAGALEVAFRQLCAKLEKQGLFAPERKRPIPAFARRIVLLTSTQTAALQDMLKVLRRFAWLQLRVCHVPVQGDGSAEKIAQALTDLNRCAEVLGGIDVILLARGGGSLEDLWEFNEEVLARAICASRIPVVTGIGHEIDVSIADLAADYHAHTPTEAAQVIAARWRSIEQELEGALERLRREVRNGLGQARMRLAQVQRHELFRRPLDRVNHLRQILDDRHRAISLAMARRLGRVHGAMQQLALRLEQHRPAARIARLRTGLLEMQRRLARGLDHRLKASRERVSRLLVGLRERSPRHGLKLSRQRLQTLEHQLVRAAEESLKRRRQEIEATSRHLEAIGPEQVLRRGYTITTDKKSGAVVRSAAQLKPGQRMVTRFTDGKTESTVEDSQQMSLFE